MLILLKENLGNHRQLIEKLRALGLSFRPESPDAIKIKIAENILILCVAQQIQIQPEREALPGLLVFMSDSKENQQINVIPDPIDDR